MLVESVTKKSSRNMATYTPTLDRMVKAYLEQNRGKGVPICLRSQHNLKSITRGSRKQYPLNMPHTNNAVISFVQPNRHNRLFTSIPDGIQANSLVLVAGQLGDEGEVADLHGCPAKLKDNDGNREVDNLPGQGGARGRVCGRVRERVIPGRPMLLTGQACVPEEEEGHAHHDGPHQVPELPPAVTQVRLVAEEANEGGGGRVCDLTNEDKEARVGVAQQGHLVEEEHQISEPHAGTEVVKDVPHAIGQLPGEGEVRRGGGGGRDGGLLEARGAVVLDGVVAAHVHMGSIGVRPPPAPGPGAQVAWRLGEWGHLP